MTGLSGRYDDDDDEGVKGSGPGPDLHHFHFNFWRYSFGFEANLRDLLSLLSIDVNKNKSD